MEKEHHPKKKNKWLKLLKNKNFLVGLFIAILIIILTLFLIQLLKPQTTLAVELGDKIIDSGESTTVKITIKNSKEYLNGTISLTTQDDAVTINHPDPSLLNVELYKNEEISRVFYVNATTTALRTDYELIASLIEKEETSNKSITLRVQR